MTRIESIHTAVHTNHNVAGHYYFSIIISVALYSCNSNIACVDTCSCMYTSVKIIKNEVGCRDDTVPKTVDTRRHCEEE